MSPGLTQRVAVGTALRLTEPVIFPSHMLRTEGRRAKFTGGLGAEPDIDTGRKAAQLAASNVPAVARAHLGWMDNASRVVRLGVSIATASDFRVDPKVADAVAELLGDVFGNDKLPCRLVYGAASLPLNAP